MRQFLKFTVIICLFLGLIVGWLGFGEKGFIHLFKMENKRQSFLEKISKLEDENQALLEEIQRLRTDKTYVESIARRELDLVKDHEILYRFTGENDNPHTQANAEGNLKGDD